MALRLPTRAVTIELSQSLIEDIDPRATVQFFQARSFNTLVVFALGYLHGETYFPSDHAPMRDGLGGRDVFAEFVSEAVAADMDVVAYVNSFFGGPDAWEPHPEWTGRWADGTETTQGVAKGMCLNSPYGARVVDVAAEICRRYPVAGVYLDEPSLQSWCSCVNCRTRYLEDTGNELPLAPSPENEEFVGFLEWRTSVVAGFVDSVGVACRAARPDVSFIAQHAFPLASTSDAQFAHLFWGRPSGRRPPQFAGWYRPSFYGQDIVREARALDVVAIEPWRRFVGTPAWWQGACVAYARSSGGGKPVMPLMEYPHFPWGLSRLSDDELRVGCADVVANGGELWWPMYAPGKADAAGWDELHTVFAELDGARPVGAVETSAAAVVVSRRTAERYAMGDCDAKYLDDLLGTVTLLRESGHPYRVVSAEAMSAETVAPLDVLLVPVGACLDERECAIVRDWVANGGHLVTLGPTASHDVTGRRRESGLLDDVLGVAQLEEEIASGLGYLVAVGSEAKGGSRPTRIPVRDNQLALDVRDATTLYEVQPMWDLFEPPKDVVGSPSVTRNTWGRGIADHIAPRLGRLRHRYELFEGVHLLNGLLDRAVPSVRGAALGADVSLHVWETPEDTRIFLVNMTSVDRSGRCSPLSAQKLVVPPGAIRSHRGAPIRTSPHERGQLVEIDHLGAWDCIVVSRP